MIVASGVLGRDRELGAIDAFFTDLGRGPAALVLTGEAGIGKSVLLDSRVAAAETHFGQVLTCRGVEAEASLSFTGLSELLAPVLDQTLSSLAPPRRLTMHRRSSDGARILLAGLSPDAREYVEGVMAMSDAELAATFGTGPVALSSSDYASTVPDRVP